jgi:hypothetical protein
VRSVLQEEFMGWEFWVGSLGVKLKGNVVLCCKIEENCDFRLKNTKNV